MKKVVLKLDMLDEKDKQKAMKIVSGLPGVDSIAVDLKESKLTVTGKIDPVEVVTKLRKSFRRAEIVTVGPATTKEGEKKGGENQKKAEDQGGKIGKGDNNQQQGQGQGNNTNQKKDSSGSGGVSKKEDSYGHVVNSVYRSPYYHYPQPNQMAGYYYARSAEEDPNACVIS